MEVLASLRLLVLLVIPVAGLAAVYWLIRLAVRHAIEDVDRRRSGPR